MLRKVASLTKPIMRRRGWKVGTLSEFYPHQRNLLGLNINGGQKICLRLRYPSDERQFLPIEHVVDTMLHEYVKLFILHGFRMLMRTGFAILFMVLITDSSMLFGTNCATSMKSLL